MCEESFHRKLHLNAHQLIHYGVAPFPCEICRKEFGTPGKLKVHMSNVHAEVKPFVCDVCDKAFAKGYYLKVHKLKHLEVMPFKCETCNKDFATASKLRNHQFVHTGNEILMII